LSLHFQGKKFDSGNNVLASAIRNNYCDFDASSTWYEVSGPLNGSKAASFLENICEINNTLLQWLVADFHLCNGSHDTAPNWELRPTYPGLMGLSEIMITRISGAMCGTSAFGIFSEYSLPLLALSELVNYNENNDGMVPISSCAFTGRFTANYSDDFYLGPFNHADTTCRNGGDPCNWFANRI